MALIACQQCGKDISQNALSCPGCGEPMRIDAIAITGIEPQKMQWPIGWIWVILAGIVFLPVGLIFLAVNLFKGQQPVIVGEKAKHRRIEDVPKWEDIGAGIFSFLILGSLILFLLFLVVGFIGMQIEQM